MISIVLMYIRIRIGTLNSNAFGCRRAILPGQLTGRYIYSDRKAHCNPFSSFVNCKSCDCERSHLPRRRSSILNIEPCPNCGLTFRQQAWTIVRVYIPNLPSGILVTRDTSSVQHHRAACNQLAERSKAKWRQGPPPKEASPTFGFGA